MLLGRRDYNVIRCDNSVPVIVHFTGLYHHFIESKNYFRVTSKISAKFKYKSSIKMKNSQGASYYLTSWFLNIKNKNIEFGMSNNILSGGYNDLIWTNRDASLVFLSQKNMHLWSQIMDYYLMFSSKKSGLKAFINIGYPYSSLPNQYNNNSMGSIIGIRKYGLFERKEVIAGFEYTRLAQGHYYTKMPTLNWYDDNKFEYYSYNGRRWAAHSGSDSDDFLIYFGIVNGNNSIIYGINYERHGVTYHFPPEVKIEQRLSLSRSYKNMSFYIYYENEYFEHYGFIDSNQNVWNETFEPGSIQKTKTVLFSIDYRLF